MQFRESRAKQSKTVEIMSEDNKQQNTTNVANEVLVDVTNRDFAEKFGQTIFNQFLKRWHNHGDNSEGVMVHGENMYEFIRIAKEIHGC